VHEVRGDPTAEADALRLRERARAEKTVIAAEVDAGRPTRAGAFAANSLRRSRREPRATVCGLK
jgi:hypothetical protein